nr:MAG TPA: major capsid protein [Caudoviricetes sp.]
MGILDYLKNVIKAKEERAEELRKLIKEATTADEVRSLGDTLNSVLDELKDAKTQLEEEEQNNGGDGGAEGPDDPTGDEGRAANPRNGEGEIRGGQVRGAYGMGMGNQTKSSDPYDTEEYRSAFMEYVCRGVPIPAEYREDQITTTADAGAVIPTTILNEIIREMKSYGNLYNKVRKLNVQGGIEIPILDLVPTAKWITEAKPSEDQKIGANDTISFSYYGLECKIAQTLLASVTTLSMFQELFPQLAAEAMIKALDIGIVNGTGSGQMLGITKETRIPEGNVITLNEGDVGSWSHWKKAVFAKMKKSYRAGEFIMAQGTFDGYIDGMVDKNGQPIGRVNYGIDGEEKYRFAGKNVEIVEDDVIKPWDTAEKGDVVAIFGDLKNYIINSNMQMKTVKWEDHDTNKIKNKCILIADGKVANPYGFLIIKKGDPAAETLQV